MSTHDAVHALLHRDISSTVYVTTGAIGTSGMLSLEQLADRAVELGAHSITHPNLDELADDRLDEQIAGGKRALETLLDTPVSSSAYPRGWHDRRFRAAVVEAACGAAATVRDAISHLVDDPFTIARWTVTAGAPGGPTRCCSTRRGSPARVAPGAHAHARLPLEATRTAVARRADRRWKWPTTSLSPTCLRARPQRHDLRPRPPKLTRVRWRRGAPKVKPDAVVGASTTAAADDRAVTPHRTARLRLGARAHKDLSDPLLRSAYSMAANSVLSAALGMGFWIVAARIYPSDVVGRDSALIAAMMQISSIAQLNMANSLIRFMPGRQTAGRMLVGAYTISGLMAIALGTGFVLVAPQVSDDFAFLTREPLTGVFYVVAVVLWGVFALQDAALTAMRQAPWVVAENALFGALKLVALPIVFVIGSGHGAFIAWVVPVCLLLVPVNWLLFRRILVASRPLVHQARRPHRRHLTRFLALDYMASVFLEASLTILPLVVLATLGAHAAGHFYIPFTIAMALDAMFWSMSTSLVAEGALMPQRVAALVRQLVRRVAPPVILAIALLTAAAPLVMLPFGEEYVRESSNVLRILLLASLFRGWMLLAAAIWRLEERGGRIAALEGSMLFGLVCATPPLAAVLGVIGVAVAWLGASLAVGCAVLPVLMRHMRLDPDTQSATSAR